MAKHELIIDECERYGAEDVKTLKGEGRAALARGCKVRIVEVATGKALVPIRRGTQLRWLAVGG